MADSAPSFSEFMQGWELGIYREPIYCGVLAGLLLGYLGVYVVLRRMVFITTAVSQAAGLGVALAFFAQIHLALQVPEVAGGRARPQIVDPGELGAGTGESARPATRRPDKSIV